MNIYVKIYLFHMSIKEHYTGLIQCISIIEQIKSISISAGIKVPSVLSTVWPLLSLTFNQGDEQGLRPHYGRSNVLRRWNAVCKRVQPLAAYCGRFLTLPISLIDWILSHSQMLIGSLMIGGKPEQGGAERDKKCFTVLGLIRRNILFQKKTRCRAPGPFYSAIKGASEKYSSIIIFLVASLHFP